MDVAIIGGGAAGFFAAINIKEKHPNFKICIFEKTKTPLGKVRISGGGRCNVTHARFDNNDLIQFYPRGSKELLSVFDKFNPKNTIDWFKKRNILLKQEPDGRMFPESNSSETIVQCFMDACQYLDIQLKTQTVLEDFEPHSQGFELKINGQQLISKNLIICSGSSEQIWQLLRKKNIPVVDSVPSLFTFNIKDELIQDLMGLVIPQADVQLMFEKSDLKKFGLNQKEILQKGPLLITHWGLSGPSILKLSAVGARILNHFNYQFNLKVNFVQKDFDTVLEFLKSQKNNHSKKKVSNTVLFGLPNRFWEKLCVLALVHQKNWSDISNQDLNKLSLFLTQYVFKVNGKSTFKDEFVTAGGVELNSVDFKTMQSKQYKGLFFAGEVLNIDALTGGFNFQAAWSEAWVISQQIGV